MSSTLQKFCGKFAFIAVAMLLVCCGCSPEGSANDSGRKNSASLISVDETRQVAMHVILNRYPKATITSENNEGDTITYRFSTNDVIVSEAVVVDRKSARGHFEKR